jgi:hypothetical protein
VEATQEKARRARRRRFRLKVEPIVDKLQFLTTIKIGKFSNM